MKKLFVLMAVSLIALVGFSSNASAVLSFNLGIGNAAIAGFPGPYAQVDVNRTDATHATITFTSLTNSGNIYLLGDGGSVDVNVNAGTWTIGSFSGSNAGVGFSPGAWNDDGSGNVDGHGVFNQTVKADDGFTSSADQISFILTNTSGTWADDAAVLTANGSGYRAAAHIFITSSPANAANGAIVTGFAAEGGGSTNVPEPTSMLLLGLGLAGFGAARRRKKS